MFHAELSPVILKSLLENLYWYGARLSLWHPCFFMPNQITIVLKNRMFSQVVLMALLAAGFEKIGDSEYLHDGVHLHLKVPAGSQNG